MPRGGGIRGGSFGGSRGGFSGGGFRGSSRTFRSSSTIRSSGRPFGRTGSRRTISRPTSGPYRHTRSSHRTYTSHTHYGPYYRPWYRRWWWWGGGTYYGGRHSIFSTIFGIIFLIIFLSIFIIPFFGLFFGSPFLETATDTTKTIEAGSINYRSTETLYYNEYWYEYEYLQAGDTIDYSVDSTEPITFFLWNKPFEELPTKSITGTIPTQYYTVKANQYFYFQIFMRPSSALDFSFTTDRPVTQFFIADGEAFNEWNMYGNPNLELSETNVDSYNNTFIASYAQDYYLVWWNEGDQDISLTFTTKYLLTGIIDTSQTYESMETTTFTSGTFTVPEGGNWYFFIYFDPMYSAEEITTITFDVTFHSETITETNTGLTISPIFIIIIIIIITVIIASIVKRRSRTTAPVPATTISSYPPSAAATTATTVTTATTTPTVSTQPEKCIRCGYSFSPGDIYCMNCGAKREGRKQTPTNIVTPISSKKCINCGKKLSPTAKFCKYCGTKVEQSIITTTPTTTAAKTTAETKTKTETTIKPKKVVFDPLHRKPFFCQIDNERHPMTDSAYQCEECFRYVCGTCYASMLATGITVCPYCNGKLTKVQ